MNYRSSNYSGRAHRTMRDAFNPYCSDELHPMPDPPHMRTLGQRISDAIRLAGSRCADFFGALFGR